MAFMPFDLPRSWLAGLTALAPFSAGVYSLLRSFQERCIAEDMPSSDLAWTPDATNGSALIADAQQVDDRIAGMDIQGNVVRRPFACDRQTALLLTGLGWLGWSLGGGRAWTRLWRKREKPACQQRSERGPKRRSGPGHRARAGSREWRIS